MVQIVKRLKLQNVVDEPYLEGVATVVETTTHLGDVGAAVALGFVGFLDFDGINGERTGHHLAGLVATDEDTVVH